MSPQNLHAAALRIPVLHILRAAGFHSTKPSVLDTLVNLTERYVLLLATQTATHALANHNSLVPELSDVRMALTDAGILLPIHSSAEEEWIEELRDPEEGFDGIAFAKMRRTKEMQRRQEDDTADVRAFTEWITGDKYKEIRRVAGMLPDASAVAGPGRVTGPGQGDGAGVAQEDFLAVLKKRNRVVADEERWTGTVLGKENEVSEIMIEGGDVGSLGKWEEGLRVKRAKQAGEKVNGEADLTATDAG